MTKNEIPHSKQKIKFIIQLVLDRNENSDDEKRDFVISSKI